LIELMISVSIMTFLISLSAPTYSAWMANMRVRNIAESINFGILQARAESIRRNQLIVFSIGADTSWEIIDSSTGKTLNKKSATESSSGVSLEILPVGANEVTFGGHGGVSVNTDATETISDITVKSAVIFDGVRNLQVKVGSGGGSFVCDPSVVDVTDFRYCRGI